MKKNSIITATFGFLFGSVCTLLVTYILRLRDQNKLTKSILNTVLDMVSAPNEDESYDEDDGYDEDDFDFDDIDTSDDDLATEEDFADYDGDDTFEKMIAKLHDSSKESSSTPSGKIVFEDDDGNPISQVPSHHKSSDTLSQKNLRAKHEPDYDALEKLMAVATSSSSTTSDDDPSTMDGAALVHDAKPDTDENPHQDSASMTMGI